MKTGLELITEDIQRQWSDDIARAIFKLGDEEGSPCQRIQFKGGQWPDAERNQGGISESALAKLIAAEIDRLQRQTKD